MKLLNTRQVAQILGVSDRRVRAMIVAGKLPAQKIGRDYAIDRRALGTVTVYGRAGRPITLKAKRGRTTKA
ncbi:MAG TPA: helix-turn-helix domain-containing protein [Candidatus Dormibacteraeota bacterium]|nr:helix-turn-helix domain-containing protein [Candidatus Dormibacteraeota bacterium]